MTGQQPLRPEDVGAWLRGMPDAELRAATHFPVLALALTVQSLIDAVGVDLDQARELVTNTRTVLDQIEQYIDREESQDCLR